MRLVRVAISAFILVVVLTLVAGWIWTGSHQPASQSAASRLVLALGMAACVVGLTSIWRTPALRR